MPSSCFVLKTNCEAQEVLSASNDKFSTALRMLKLLPLILCFYLDFVCLDALQSCPVLNKLIFCELVQSLLCTRFSVTWLKSVIAKASAYALAKLIVLCLVLFLRSGSHLLQPPVSCTLRIQLKAFPQEGLAAVSRAIKSLTPSMWCIYSLQLPTQDFLYGRKQTT